MIYGKYVEMSDRPREKVVWLMMLEHFGPSSGRPRSGLSKCNKTVDG